MSRLAEFTQLFAAEGPKLRRFLRRFGPKVSPEDIAQDSFERLYAAEPDALVSPRAFLFRTARNLAIDALRRAGAAPMTNALPQRLDAAASSEPDPEQQLLLSEASEHLNRALSALPEHKRSALLLFKLERRSYKEIGAHLSVSPRTVERYVADAIAHCHQELRTLSED